MKKITYFGASLLAIMSLVGCGTNKGENVKPDDNTPVEPEVKPDDNKPVEPDEPTTKYDTPSEEYKSTYNEIKTFVFDIGDNYDGILQWDYYIYPLDTDYTKVYYCSFLWMKETLYAACSFEENEVETQAVLLELPSFDKYLKDTRIFAVLTKELGEKPVAGTLNPTTYNRITSELNFENTEPPVDEATQGVAVELMNFLLDSLKERTAYDIKNLGFEVY